MLKIAGIQVAEPTDIEVSRFDLSKSSRTASGKMVMEIIRSNVRRVDCTWALIKDSDLRQILDLIDAYKPFFQLTFTDVGSESTMTCYVGDRKAPVWYRKNGERYWRNVTISFIEQ